MATSQMLGERWVLPTLESNEGGVVALHVSIAVGSVDAINGQPVGVGVVAGGQQLNLRQGPAVGSYYYLRTRAVTAVADFAFDNPDGLAVDSISVTFGDQTGTWQMGEPATPPPSDLPVA